MPYRGSYEAESSSRGSANWLGFQEVALTDFINKSENYENLDVYMEIHFQNESSQYPFKYNLLGKFERDADGRISGENSLLKRILYLTDAIGWNGGVNAKGEWVDEDDKVLEDDVALLLNAKYTQANYGASNFDTPLYIYVYKKWSKEKQKAYTTVVPKIVQNNEQGRSDLESYITYMKANKYIVEHDDSEQVRNGAMPSGTSTTTSGTQTSF
tara:strand:- start:131 stop:769 length:639 start_codon:yes stop_codon:yes gene_type:complete